MKHDDGDAERRCCGLCGKILPPHDSISVTDVGDRCHRCFNEELADRLGVDFDNTPIGVTDADGVRHRFEIRSMLVAIGHAMYAPEVTNRDAAIGYRFPILGDHETDAHDPFTLLRARIRQGLSVRHVQRDRARVAAHAGAPAQRRHRVGPRDRRCAPASRRRWADVHLGSEAGQSPCAHAVPYSILTPSRAWAVFKRSSLAAFQGSVTPYDQFPAATAAPLVFCRP